MTIIHQPPAAIYRGNALDLPLPDDSVDLVVTSPPYFGLRSYQDGGEHYADQIGAEATPAEFIDALIAATAEMIRVVKPTGSIWVNLGDKYATAGTRQGNADGIGEYGQDRTERARHIVPRPAGFPQKSLMGIPWRYAIRCVDELGLVMRQEIIWAKPNGMPESVTDRARRAHETWFHFTLASKYYADMDPIREAHKGAPGKGTESGDYSKGSGRVDGGVHGSGGFTTVNAKGKLPGTVRSVPTEPLKVPAELGIDHFAAFPTEWPRWIIRGWTPPGGVVLDPFGGTGTTALVASVLGRHGISVDLSRDYCRLAQWRTTDPKQRARVAKRDDLARPPGGES